MPEQHPPVQQPTPHVTSLALPVERDLRSSSLTERIARISPLNLAVMQWASCSIIVAVLLFPTLFTSLMTIPGFPQSGGAIMRIRMWQRSFGFNPYGADPLLPPQTAFLLFLLVLAVIVAFGTQAIAFWKTWSGSGDRHATWQWWIGPIGSHVIMLFMAPMSADVFFYAMTGDMAANGNNPYTHALRDFPENPLFRYNHWIDMTTVYGPVWTTINRALMTVTGPDPFLAVLTFKIFLGISALALAGVVWFIALRLTESRRLAACAFVLVAWQPNMIVETSGQAHNDSFMLLLLVAGIGTVLVWGSRYLRLALTITALSIGVKYVTLPIVGLVALLRLATTRHDRHTGWRLARAWALDGFILIVVASIFIAPYWTGPEFFREMVREPGRLFSNPIFQPRLRSFMREIGLGSTLRMLQHGLPVIMQTLVVLFLLREAGRNALIMFTVGRRATEETSGIQTRGPLPTEITVTLLQSWMAIAIALSMCTPNAHSWYLTWPVVPIALYLVVQRRRGMTDYRATTLPHWFWAYLTVTGLMTIASFQVS
ncbi:MAG: hypothetical protein QM753_05240 [Thermomicrobiales bacterium]